MKPLRHIHVSIQIVLSLIVAGATLPAQTQAQVTAPVQLSPQTQSSNTKMILPHGLSYSTILPDPKRIAMFQQIEQFKLDGLSGNRTRIPEMIIALKDTEPIEKQTEAWFTLARLGAVEAVPIMDGALKQVFLSPNTEQGEFTRASRARLLAETEATPHAQAIRFFQEIGETPTQLSATLQKQHQEQNLRLRVTSQPLWKEMAALNMLADMIYHGPAAELLADPFLAPVDFGLSPEAYYKVQIAQLAPQQQRQKLIGWLVTDPYPYAPGQLLIDLGRSEAIEAITAKLQELDQNDAAYHQYHYGALLSTLHVCDLQHQLPIWHNLKHLSKPPTFGPANDVNNQIKLGY